MISINLLATLSTTDKLTLTGVIIAGLGLLFVILKFIKDKIYSNWEKAAKIESMGKDIKDNIKPELVDLRKAMNEQAKEIREKLSEILQTLTLKQVSQAQSPRALNDFGKQVLEQSGIRAIIEPKLDQIIDTVKSNKPENPYQVQEMLLDIVQDLKNEPELKNAIEQAAFKSGVSVETVLLVGGIDIRDTVLDRLGMTPDDIDTHQNKTK